MAIDKKIIGALCIILAAALWGADGVLLRPQLYHLSVPLVVFIEHALAFLFMVGFLYYERANILRLTKGDWWAFLWIAAFGGAIGTMAITKALFYVNFEQLSVIILLQKLQPLFAIVLAMVWLKEKPRTWFYPLAVLALIGSYLLTFGFRPPVFAGNKIAIAALLSLVAAFSYGSCTTVGKKVLKAASFRLSTYLRFGLTAAIMLAVVLATRQDFTAVTLRDLGFFFLIIFTSGAAAMFIYYYGLRNVRATTSSILELSFPVTAVVLDYLINGTVLSIGQYIGAGIVVMSMTLVARLK